MANKIIDISTPSTKVETKQSTNTEIYKDINLASIFSPRSQIKTKQDDGSLVVTRAVNVKAVYNAINNIFNFFPGERILYPEFGSRLKLYLYEGITEFNIEQIIGEINSNLLQFDSRVIVDDLQSVTTADDANDNTVVVRIIFHIKDLPLEYYSYDYSYTRGL